MSVAIRSVSARMARAVFFSALSLASLWMLFDARDGMAQGPSMLFQNFDGPGVPVNKEGVNYPTYYVGTGEGGNFTSSIDTGKKIVGAGSLKMHLTSGYGLYAQFNPYDGVNRDFARIYSSNPSGWQFNTYNRMRFWFFNATGGEPEQIDGTTNYYMGTYVKHVTNADPTSDEAGGGHYYHPFNVLRGQWSMCTFNFHPGHERGDPGATDTGVRQYPTAPPWGSGDPAATYNYFDTLTRWYISGTIQVPTLPQDYWLDQIEFYQEPYAENDQQVYSICVSYTAATNRIFLTWNRPKDDNTINHEVRYAFSDIHALGWDNATAAPNGIITPPGYQGYNGMVYDTKAINVSGKSVIYLAIKPQNSSVFSQVAFPLTNVPVASLSPPTNLRVVQ